MQAKTPERSGVFLWPEFLLLFGGAPLLILLARRPGVLFLLLWLGGFVTYRASRAARASASPPDLGRTLRRLSLFAPFRIGLLLRLAAGKRSAAERAADQAISFLLLRFCLFGTVLTVLTWAIFPALFLSLPRQHPMFWLIIMVLYPLLSVWPQEVLYRRFLFHRYEKAFGPRGVIAASALAFGFAHIIFLNWFAVALTTAGGAMFARNFSRERSLFLSCLEHSLYGCLIFTIGLGRFFYTGAAWHH